MCPESIFLIDHHNETDVCMLADNIQMERKRTRVPVLSILMMYFIFVKPPHNIETCSAFPWLQSNVTSMSWDFRRPVEEGVLLPNDRGKWAQWGSKHSLGHFSFPIQSNRFSFKWTGRHGWVHVSSTFFYLSNIWSQGSPSKLSLDEQSGWAALAPASLKAMQGT